MKKEHPSYLKTPPAYFEQTEARLKQLAVPQSKQKIAKPKLVQLPYWAGLAAACTLALVFWLRAPADETFNLSDIQTEELLNFLAEEDKLGQYLISQEDFLTDEPIDDVLLEIEDEHLEQYLYEQNNLSLDDL